MARAVVSYVAADSAPTFIQSMDSRGVADSNLLLVVVTCAIATAGAITLTRRRLRAATTSGVASQPHVTITSPHSAVIEDLLRAARTAHREGLATLAHPMNRANDDDVQYALDLISSRADPRIVRGVLTNRYLNEAPTANTPWHTRRAMIVAAMSMLGLIVSLWITSWIIDSSRMAQAAAGLFGGLCLISGSICFFTANRRSNKTPRETDDSLVTKHTLIVTAAEAIARGDSPADVERALFQSVVTIVPNTPHAAAA